MPGDPPAPASSRPRVSLAGRGRSALGALRESFNDAFQLLREFVTTWKL
jgi:hypothetical protein